MYTCVHICVHVYVYACACVRLHCHFLWALHSNHSLDLSHITVPAQVQTTGILQKHSDAKLARCTRRLTKLGKLHETHVQLYWSMQCSQWMQPAAVQLYPYLANAICIMQHQHTSYHSAAESCVLATPKPCISCRLGSLMVHHLIWPWTHLLCMCYTKMHSNNTINYIVGLCTPTS